MALGEKTLALAKLCLVFARGGCGAGSHTVTAPENEAL
jgi:hypothetical protein